MADFSRRRLLRTALGAGGAGAAAALLPPNLQQAVAEPAKHPGSLHDIEHVVILMMENRSFDHYFGTMPGVRGFDDPKAAKLPDGRSVFYQPDPKNPDGYLLPFHLNTRTSSAQAIPSTSHAWTVQHQALNNGAMDNWLPAHREADGDAHAPYVMGYYDRRDIPFHFALAETFTLCDAYHCSLIGPTWPNRIYHWTGMIDPNGTGGGPVTSNVVPKPFTWTTYPERLTKAGVSWHVYQEEDDYGCNPLEFFAAYQDASPGDALYEHGVAIGPPDQFEQDALHGRLPTVSWIIPTSAQSEHPDYLPASGADFIARQLDAVAANRELWRKTVFIINYDENDGLFDHVVPPTAPAGTPDEYVGDLPIGAGVRVPCIIVSPWTQGGYVSSEPFDHTSVLRFLERFTGVRETNISAWRRRTFGDLTSALGLPRNRPFPTLPETKRRLWQAEYEVATLPPPTLPGADQSPPHQGRSRQRSVPKAPAVPHELRGDRPYFRSRIVEDRTTHRADFPHGTAGTNFPGIQDSVPAEVPAAPELAYVPSMGSGTVNILDAYSHKLVGSIRAGANPYGAARTPDGGKLYVTASGASSVSVLDTRSGKVTSEITVGLYPHSVVVSPDGAHAYVADTGPDTGRGGSRSVSVIDTSADKVADTWSVGTAPHGVAVTPDGRTLYATCWDGLAAVDTGSGRVRRRLGELAEAVGVAMHPDGRHVYVTHPRSGVLAVVDTRHDRVVARVRVGRAPWQASVAPDGSRVYVTCANDDAVKVVDTGRHRVVGSVRVGHIPTGVLATRDTVWVTANTSSTVDTVDPKNLERLGSAPLGYSSLPSDVVVAPGRPGS